MCGIVGVISANYGAKIGKFMEDGLVVGQVRGFDSTGIMLQDFQGNIRTHKAAMIGTDFASDKVTFKLLAGSGSSRAIIAHHRAATQGKVSNDNAHPFVVRSTDDKKSIIGCHNGSLVNWKRRPTAAKFDVDSHWAISRIAELGNEAFTEIEGPFAMVWMDSSKRDRVFIARNAGRPLHAMMSSDNKQMYIASEAGMLQWLVERNDIACNNEVIVFDPGVIFEVDASGPTISVSSTPCPAPVPLPVQSNVAQFKRSDTVPKHTGNYTPPAYTGVTMNGFMVSQTAKDWIEKLQAAIDYEPVAAGDDAEEEIVAQRAEDIPGDAFEDELVPEDWIAQYSVSDAEAAAAKKAGVFRELNWFEGVCHDDTTGDTLGDIDMYIPGSGKRKLMGVLRGCSEARANAEYINNKTSIGGGRHTMNGGWVVVVGMRDDTILGKTLIVAELNRKGHQELEAMHSA